jgi:hypothetical protein
MFICSMEIIPIGKSFLGGRPKIAGMLRMTAEIRAKKTEARLCGEITSYPADATPINSCGHA